MKITIFTSDSPRHYSLINKLSAKHKCYAVIEKKNNSSKKRIKKKQTLKEKYFNKVLKSENKIFKNDIFLKKCEKFLFIKYPELSNTKKKYLNTFLKSDLFIVFGSSYIKGWLINFLIKKKALNIHMGISPYYRGSACNFWALYDKNPHFVGATIHYLNRGLDDGKILFHVLPGKKNKNSFDFTMGAVNSAQTIMVKQINNKNIFKLKSVKQNKKKEIRYSTNKEFNNQIISSYLKRKTRIDFNYNKNLYINPKIDS